MTNPCPICEEIFGVCPACEERLRLAEEVCQAYREKREGFTPEDRYEASEKMRKAHDEWLKATKQC